MNKIQNFVKSRMKTYSKEMPQEVKSGACPVCHSSPCTCSGTPVSTSVTEVSETEKLDGIKSKLLGLIDFSAVADENIKSDIKDNILKANKSDLLKMVREEIEDVSKIKATEPYVNGLKEIESELATFCGDQKTYSKIPSKESLLDIYESRGWTWSPMRDPRDFIKENYDKFDKMSFDELIDLASHYIDVPSFGNYNPREFLAPYVSVIKPDPIGYSKEQYNNVNQKTYSAMAELDLDFKGDLKALLKKYESSVTNLPKIGSNDTAEEFWTKCIKWADKVDENPEPALYDELVALGKKYHVEVN